MFFLSTLDGRNRLIPKMMIAVQKQQRAKKIEHLRK